MVEPPFTPDPIHKQKALFFAGFIALIILLFYGVELMFVIQHETVHREIDISYDCKTSTEIHYLTLGGTTSSSCPEWKQEREDLHLQNEIIGYNIRVLITAILCATISILFGMYYFSKDNP